MQTVAENAIPGYEFKLWYGIVVPAGTPRPIIDRLNADLRKTMASPDVKEKLASIGGNLTVGSPDEFAAMIRSEAVRWAKLARDSASNWNSEMRPTFFFFLKKKKKFLMSGLG